MFLEVHTYRKEGSWKKVSVNVNNISSIEDSIEPEYNAIIVMINSTRELYFVKENREQLIEEIRNDHKWILTLGS